MSKNKNKFKQRQALKVPAVELDIVIPFRIVFDYLDKCLAAIPAACGNLTYHIYIVDNATENVPEEVYKKYASEHCTISRFQQNLGFPIACNFGAKQGKGKYLLFLNSDCFMNPGSIEILYRKLESSPEIGIVGPKLIFPTDVHDESRPAGKIQHAGLSFNIKSEVHHIFIGWDANSPIANVSCVVPAVTGACLMIPRKLFTEVGGFYDGYGIGTYEDIDLCFAVRSKQKVVWYEATSVGYHIAGGTITRDTKGPQFPLQRNKAIFMSRWGQALWWSDFERY